MKFAIAEEHRDFFLINKWIEFEGIFTEDEISLLNKEIRDTLSRRCAIATGKLSHESIDKLYEEGRDLWRDSPAIKNLTCHRRLGELAFQLMGEKPVRIGYDQYFPPLDLASKHLGGKYTDFLNKRSAIKEISSIQGLVAAMIIALQDEEGVRTGEKRNIFPSRKGNVAILHPDTKLDWRFLLEGERKSYYLAVFATGKSVYMRNSKDPLSGNLIQLGYASGDRLNDEKNPIIYR